MMDGRPITLRSDAEVAAIREAGRVLAAVHLMIRAEARPGVATARLDKLAEEIIRGAGAEPSFKGYAPPGRRPFPATLCTSIDSEIVHGIPGPRALREGEILSVDVGAKLDGFHADAALTVPVGEVDEDALALIRVTAESLELAIAQVRDGNRIGDIGAAVQGHVEAAGYSIVRDFVGHGIGRELHEAPEIPNFGHRGFGPRIKPGMVLAIEPMVNEGGWRIVELDDGWTAVTADGSRSAHFEHTVAATHDGQIVLTLP